MPARFVVDFPHVLNGHGDNGGAFQDCKFARANDVQFSDMKSLGDVMDRVGVSFASSLTSDEVHAQYIRPLRAALESSRGGFYLNYVRRPAEGDAAPEHLIMFQVHDFEAGLRLLRTTMDELGPPAGTSLHNLNVSDPMY